MYNFHQQSQLDVSIHSHHLNVHNPYDTIKNIFYNKSNLPLHSMICCKFLNFLLLLLFSVPFVVDFLFPYLIAVLFLAGGNFEGAELAISLLTLGVGDDSVVSELGLGISQFSTDVLGTELSDETGHVLYSAILDSSATVSTLLSDT